MKKKERINRQGAAAFLFFPAAVFLLAVLTVFLLWEDHDEPPKVREGQFEQLSLTDVPESEEISKKTRSQEDEILENMTLEEKVAQLFFVTPEALTGVNVAAAAGETTREAFSERPVGGIIYFSDNLQAKTQTETMLSNMEKISMDRLGIPVLLGTDEEGGRVTRIAGYSDFQVENVGPMGSLGTVDAAENAGKTIGSYLVELGFNMDFAPVADVAENPENTVIGDRAFGSDPKITADLVASAVKGFHEAGMLTTLKHFPGHGSTKEDSHDGFAYNNKTREELIETDFLPFQAGIEAGADLIMVGHISLPNILADDTPASLSQTVVTGYLRELLGFNGVIVTDSLSMKAITDHYTPVESVERALDAGVDMILMPPDFENVYESVLSDVQSGRITEERIDASIRRIIQMKLKIKK